MTPEQILNLVINGGGTAVLIWLVAEMRKEANEERNRTWRLLNYLICERDPNCDESNSIHDLGLGPKD